MYKPYTITRRSFLRHSVTAGVAVGVAAATYGWLPGGGLRSAYAYEEAGVSDGGIVKGRITFSGKVPTNMAVPDDPDICGQPRELDQVMVGDDGAVQDAVVYCPDITSGKSWAKMDPPLLDNIDCRFAPQMVAMNPGPIKIRNSDPILHNTHVFYGRRTAFNVALPNEGQEIEQSLERPGLLRIECDEHGHMHAAGYVAANPYYSATGDTGEFEIADVPPGDYTFVVYQRTTGPREVMITVEAGKSTDLSVDLSKK